MNKTLRLIFALICLAVFCFAGYKLVSALVGYRQASNYYDSTAATFVTYTEQTGLKAGEEPDAPAAEESSESAAAPEAPEAETVPIEVDFSALLDTCGDVIGWLYSEDTVINYPVVQSADNDYYLHRMLDGSHSSNGTIFMDYLCSPDLTCGNTLLYGHNMRDGSMFHSLTEYASQEYYDEHPVLYYLTPQQNYRIELFSGVTAPADGWPYVIEFGTEEEKEEFLRTAVRESTFDAKVEPDADDTIITLSTCTYEYDNARYLVFGIVTPIS